MKPTKTKSKYLKGRLKLCVRPYGNSITITKQKFFNVTIAIDGMVTNRP